MSSNYESWFGKVAAATEKFAGVSPDDLADYGYADAFEAGRKPEAVAKAALRADGFSGKLPAAKKKAPAVTWDAGDGGPGQDYNSAFQDLYSGGF